MIQVIFGRKGSGKTKRILNMANESVKTTKGEIVFIDDDARYMFDLRHEVRFVNAKEYKVSTPNMFLGFLSGIIAANYDMNEMYVDGFLRLVGTKLSELESFFDRLETLADQHNLRVIISTSGEGDEPPAFLQKYLI